MFQEYLISYLLMYQTSVRNDTTGVSISIRISVTIATFVPVDLLVCWGGRQGA